MSKVIIGLGSNLGDRMHQLQQGVVGLHRHAGAVLKTSGVYETPALLPPHAPEGWNLPFLNAAVEIQYSGPPQTLLMILKKIEQSQGRKSSGGRWQPRPLDLDILLFADLCIEDKSLKVPHPGLRERAFVLSPLKDIDPQLKIPGRGVDSVLHLSRQLKEKCPAWMHIVNVTPDSFSDGRWWSVSKFQEFLKNMYLPSVQVVDLGAESTRPGARPIPPEEEWQRLKPYLQAFQDFYNRPSSPSTRRQLQKEPPPLPSVAKTFAPAGAGKPDPKTKTSVLKCHSEPTVRFLFATRLSVDTRHASTARLAVPFGVSIINDVSGLKDPEMVKVLQNTEVDYVLTHSLSVPVKATEHLPVDKDPVQEIRQWLKAKLEFLEKQGIPRGRVIFDPGIGFGKTPGQCLQILNRIEEFFDFDVRVLVGASRKSFIKSFTCSTGQVQPTREEGSALGEQSGQKPPPCPASKPGEGRFFHQRDPESMGISLSLALRGVDMIRVHNSPLHAQMFAGFSHTFPPAPKI